MLTKLVVDNYKAFDKFECTFGPRQLILGRNGAGKSTISMVLRAMRAIIVNGEPVRDYFGGRTRTRWLSQKEQNVRVSALIDNSKYDYELVIGLDSFPVVVEEVLKIDDELSFKCKDSTAFRFSNGRRLPVTFSFDKKRSSLAAFSQNSTRNKAFLEWFEELLIIDSAPRQMSGVAEKESPSLDPSLSNFVEWYRHIRQETSDYEYIQDLQQVIPGLESIRLAEAGEGRRELKVRMKKRGPTAPQQPSTEEYTFSELSDGQRILIALYAILHFAAKPGATLCFDEPDNYLSLFEIQPWLTRMLEKTEEENGVQVLIASHHPEIINWMAFKEGLVLDRPDGLGVTVQPFRDKDKTGLSASELVTRGWDVE